MKSKLMLLAGIVAFSASATLVGCNKEANTATPAANSSNGTVPLASVAHGGAPLLSYDEKITQCPDGRGGCAPETVIHGYDAIQLDQVISTGGSSVANFFSDESVALELIPDFNESYFTSVRAAILSGNYNFDKVVNGNKVFYLLGPDGSVDHSNPLFAFQYRVVP